MSPIESRKPEMACRCSHRAPVTTPPSGKQTCPDCGDEMYLIGSAEDFNNNGGKTNV